MKVKTVELSKIEQNENSRVIYKTQDLAELMLSMRQDGLLQPVGLIELPDGKYDAVWGNRRIIAAKKLGWFDIPAHILPKQTKDTDRDLLNLTENFKRQQTTVKEDGRMFDSLITRGLSEKELSTRLGISMSRIETALEVHRGLVPAEFRDKIVNVHGTTRRKAGTITASSASVVLSARRRGGLTPKDTKTLLKFAADSGTSQAQVRQVIPHFKSGATIGEAIEAAKQLKMIRTDFMLPRKDIQSIENKHELSVQDFVFNILSGTKEFKNIVKIGKNKPTQVSSSVRSEARKINK